MRRFFFFDLDGTLADTDCDIRLAWKAALKALGLESPDFDEKYVTGPPIREILQLLFPEQYTPELEESARREFGIAYDNCGFPNTPEYPDVMDRVRELKASGARVFIATNKRWLGAKAIAEKFGWLEVFEGLYTGDMHKDDPAIGVLRKPKLLARIMAEHGAKPDECVMVGDTCNDFEAAKKNGIASVAVTWGYGKPEELAMADRIAHTPAEI